SIVGFTGYSGVAVCAAAIRHGLTFDPVMIFKILVIPALTISNVGAVPLARHRVPHQMQRSKLLNDTKNQTLIREKTIYTCLTCNYNFAWAAGLSGRVQSIFPR